MQFKISYQDHDGNLVTRVTTVQRQYSSQVH